MLMTYVRKKAKGVGIDCGKMKKVELIRTIQRSEGFQECFGTSGGNCDQDKCCFMKDCLKVK